MPASEWHKFFALAVVPEGAVNMNAGVEYHQESGGDHGSVYFDDVNMFIPVTQSIMQVSHSDLVMAAMQDSVNQLTVEWDVAAMDVWDMTPSNNGPFTVTLDLSATLGVDNLHYLMCLHCITTIQTHLILLQTSPMTFQKWQMLALRSIM